MKACLRASGKVMLLFLSLWFGMAQSVSGAENTLMYVNTNTVTVRLTIDASRRATVTGAVRALKASYPITGTLSVERKSGKSGWNTYKTWKQESGKGSMTQTKTVTLPSGYTYRAKLTVDVAGEGITKYSGTV